MSLGGLIGGTIVALVAVAAFNSGGDQGAAPLPSPTVPSSAAMTVPPSGPPNPGYGMHCNYGPNDNDVRGVVKAATPKLPDC